MVLNEVKKFFFGSKENCSRDSTCDDSCCEAPKKKIAKKSRKRK